MTKSAEAFRTISEAAAELDVPQHVLRFWESKFGQIRPMKRGGGRRYYRPSDLDLLRGVRALLYDEGYTIKGVQKLFRERGAKYIADLGRGDVETPTPEADAKPASGAASGLSGGQQKAIEKALSRLEALKISLDRALAKDDARRPRGDAGKPAKKAAG